MNNLTFNNLYELFTRLKPALNSKVKELKNNGIKYINQDFIWNCLKDTKWKLEINLTLNDMVEDILNTSNEYFVTYYYDALNKKQEQESSLL